jgi:ABC-type Zn uptake system ZnuABC Zn-binding protein ZnuA
MAMIAEADLVFMVGAGLEEFLDGRCERTGGNARLVEVSDGIELLEFEHEGEERTAEETSTKMKMRKKTSTKRAIRTSGLTQIT